ncbi:MAG: VanW family protein [Actinobacteria bacterium]|nr:VanW family protein [Actinomycetota bacterium]
MTRLQQELRGRGARRNSFGVPRRDAEHGKKHGQRRSRLVGAVLVLCAVAAVLVAADYWSNSGKIYKGVEIGSMSLGGKTPEEARRTIEESTGMFEEVKLIGPEKEEFALSAAELGVGFDVEATVDKAYAVGRRGSILERIVERTKADLGTVRVPLIEDYERERIRDGLSDIISALAVEPVEAGFEVSGNTVSVTGSQAGKKVDEEELLDDLEAGLPEGQREYEVPVVIDEPQLTTEEAERMKPTELLGSYRTNYTIVPDDGARVGNLDISSGAVNGTLLAPGEVFSMNQKVATLDYNAAKVIVNGAETKADGGGLCQVTSTLYNAANFAGLDVIERTPHSAQLPYIRPGMDATVWFGGPGEADDLDMKFRNTTDGYLLLREYVAEDGYVHAEIWGRPNDVDVEMYSEPTNVGDNGSEWVTYQKVEKDGEVLFDGVLHKDSYEPLVDEHGKEIPPSEVPVAPVDP